MTRLEAALAEFVEALRDEVASTSAVTAPDRLLSIAEVAELLGVGRSTLYGEVQAGRLHSLKVGRRRLIPSAAVAAYTAR